MEQFHNFDLIRMYEYIGLYHYRIHRAEEFDRRWLAEEKRLDRPWDELHEDLTQEGPRAKKKTRKPRQITYY